MQKKNQKHNSTYSILKSLKNRLSFAFKKKGFLSKPNEKIEVLELEEIEVLEEIPTEKVLRTKNDVVEYLDVEEPKLRRKTVRLKPVVKKRLQFASYALSAACVFLLAITFFFTKDTMKVGVQNILYRLGIYTQEIKKVEIESNDYNNPGSWKITKTAQWVDKGKIHLTVSLNSLIEKSNDHKKDIVLVLDTSESMRGKNWTRIKEDSEGLIEYILEDSENKVAIIQFDSYSNILSDFTNEKGSLLRGLASANLGGETNYNAALQAIDELMNDYTPENNRDTIVLFITDGYPTEQVSSQNGTYQLLKDKYPYMVINGIQYEIGDEVINQITQVSDVQWVSNQYSLRNILIEAAVQPVHYEEMIVSEYIGSDFIIDSVNDISSMKGTIRLEEENGLQKVIWNLGNNKFVTGTVAQLDIRVSLKNQDAGLDDFYPTSQKTSVTYRLENESEKTTNSTKTTVLKSAYEVTYNVNPPAGCDIESETTEKHLAFRKVEKRNDNVSCDGYFFKGWEIDSEDNKDINYINDDTFLMPQHDVHIRGTWAKLKAEMKVDGTVYERTTLYRVLEKEAEKGVYAREYTGDHQDSMDASLSTRKIYHWYANNNTKGTAIQNKYNVIFANQCWQMIRTTDTGGVKLLYNGEAVGNKCLTTRGNHVTYGTSSFYATRAAKTVQSNYYYGTDYIYNSETGRFQLQGTILQSEMNESMFEDLKGKYTCLSSNDSSTCNPLYVIESYKSTTEANVLSISDKFGYSGLGLVEFNENDFATNPNNNSLSYVGYMYNREQSPTHYYPSSNLSTFSTTSLGTSYWFGDASWNSETGKWTMSNVFKPASSEEYSDLVGKYTFLNSKSYYSYFEIYYVVSVNDTTATLTKLGPGESTELNARIYMYGDSYTKNEDGTYTIPNYNSIDIIDWSSQYRNLYRKYICKEIEPGICGEVYYTYSMNNSGFYGYIVKNQYKYASGFRYEDGKYILDGDIVTLWKFTETENEEALNTHHYTCLNEEGECEKIYYVFAAYKTNGKVSSVSTFALQNGEDINQFMEEMLWSDDVNKTNSTIKNANEFWYKKYLLDYSDYIEDVIYCNDRTIISYNNFDPNGGNVFSNIYFSEQFKCSNITDRFSVTNEKAKLEYPIGLLTYNEVNLMGNAKVLENAEPYASNAKLLTPKKYAGTNSLYVLTTSGGLHENDAYSRGYLRPAISLKPGIGYASGDGSMDDPYIVDLDND